ncbi:hypothetical protein HanRHA438_Chr13g0600671 [Helianthus annuus]|nr:hypothetical protein HanRHA438_Chr13g0600671 [Helianthus annuus]
MTTSFRRVLATRQQVLTSLALEALRPLITDTTSSPSPESAAGLVVAKFYKRFEILKYTLLFRWLLVLIFYRENFIYSSLNL